VNLVRGTSRGIAEQKALGEMKSFDLDEAGSQEKECSMNWKLNAVSTGPLGIQR
jgi:hypothetical protein